MHGHGIRHHARHVAPVRGRAETRVDGNRPSASQLPERSGIEVRLVSERSGKLWRLHSWVKASSAAPTSPRPSPYLSRSNWIEGCPRPARISRRAGGAEAASTPTTPPARSRPGQVEIVNDQRNRLRELLQSREQQIIGSSAVRGEALVKRHQRIVAGQRNLSGSSLNRPDNAVKEPCRLGIEAVQRQPGALEIALADPIAQKGRFAVAGRRCDQRQPVGISGRSQSVFQTRALQWPQTAQRRPEFELGTRRPFGILRLSHVIDRRQVQWRPIGS